MLEIHIKWILAIAATIIFLIGIIREANRDSGSGYGAGIGSVLGGLMWIGGYLLFWVIWLIIFLVFIK